jgi:hypothetical protein
MLLIILKKQKKLALKPGKGVWRYVTGIWQKPAWRKFLKKILSAEARLIPVILYDILYSERFYPFCLLIVYEERLKIINIE